MKRTPRRTVALALVTCLTSLGLSTGLAAVAAGPASAASGDDYPYRTDTSQTHDNWGFTKRQCVSFVAWRLAQRHHALQDRTQNWGSAYHWDVTARNLGYRVSSRPVVGAIAQWHAGERSAWYGNGSNTPNGYVQPGQYGHVAFVRQVYSDGSVLVEQYNVSGNRAYSALRVKAPRFLYLG